MIRIGGRGVGGRIVKSRVVQEPRDRNCQLVRSQIDYPASVQRNAHRHAERKEKVLLVAIGANALVRSAAAMPTPAAFAIHCVIVILRGYTTSQSHQRVPFFLLISYFSVCELFFTGAGGEGDTGWHFHFFFWQSERSGAFFWSNALVFLGRLCHIGHPQTIANSAHLPLSDTHTHRTSVRVPYSVSNHNNGIRRQKKKTNACLLRHLAHTLYRCHNMKGPLFVFFLFVFYHLIGERRHRHRRSTTSLRIVWLAKRE